MPAVIATIPVGNFPGVIAVSPDGARAYVGGGTYGVGVTVVDLAQRRVGPVGAGP